MSASALRKSPFPDVRRVVTGHNPAGQATILEDALQPATSWGGFDTANPKYDLHYTGRVPALVDSELSSKDGYGRWVDEMKAHSSDVYAKEGALFRVSDFAPGSTTPVHRTESLDYGIVAKGSIVLVLEDGKQVTLGEGDTIIQRATMHSWRNESGEWARIYFVGLGAKPVVLVDGRELKEEWRSE
ncbi:Cupin-2 domain-containing protein [Mycena chlorophos]|uniref:Cupin-2 domain-containing protein n=1 Tax=Mycena chlorophos TaxID=658473 RepID=A0A8H6WL65_MYCCL|nr:Cupin-2 domain-containing protein [Mycena chlorophos]